MTKAVLITGGAKRVGEHLSLAFAKAGWDVAIHCHSSKKYADTLQKKITALGRNATVLTYDLEKASGLEALIKQAKKAFPNLCLLINNASIFERASLLQTTEANFDRHMNINLKAPLFLSQAFAKHVKSGHIINILDTYVDKNEPSHFAYLLSKKALRDVTQMAAVELGPKIRVNGICPGMLLPTKGYDGAYVKKLKVSLPLKETPQLKDVSSAALWLDATASVTGQCIYLDGGHHLL